MPSPRQHPVFIGLNDAGGSEDDSSKWEIRDKYYLTAPGRRITATALKLREMFIIPSLQGLLYED